MPIQRAIENVNNRVNEKRIQLDPELFHLSSDQVPLKRQKEALATLECFLKQQQKHFLGYQLNQTVAYSEKLAFMLDMHTNNVGDPFVDGNLTTNTKLIERTVLDYFARLWNAETPSDPENEESYWGYIASMGGTEGNLYGLYNAREYLRGKPLYYERKDSSITINDFCKNNSKNVRNHFRPVLFYSQDTHYSIKKDRDILGIDSFHEIGEKEYRGQCPITPDGRWPKEVPSENGNGGPGSIDVDKLIRLVQFFAEQGFPPLIVLNLGTTFKGAYDNVEQVGQLLKPVLEKYGLFQRRVEYASGKFDTRTGFWIHIDGALGASYLPFLQKVQDSVDARIPRFDFSLPFVHSIVASAHKFSGCPMPTGIYMTKRKYQVAPPSIPEYIGSPDTTLAGSRNAIGPAVLWYYYANTSYEEEASKALEIENMARYAEMKCKQLEKNYEDALPLWVARAPLSLSIIFRDPEDADLIKKYSLSQMKLTMNDELEPRKYVHIYIMKSTTKDLIDEFVIELSNAYGKLAVFKRLTVAKQNPFGISFKTVKMHYESQCGSM